MKFFFFFKLKSYNLPIAEWFIVFNVVVDLIIFQPNNKGNGTNSAFKRNSFSLKMCFLLWNNDGDKIENDQNEWYIQKKERIEIQTADLGKFSAPVDDIYPSGWYCTLWYGQNYNNQKHSERFFLSKP